jgi:hypothetical protein
MERFASQHNEGQAYNRKGNIMYTLNVSFALDEDFVEKSNRVMEIVGKHSGSSGAGFGERDMQFYFDTREECEIAKNKFLTLEEFDVQIEEGGI